jgi:hypothetical protein
MGGFNIPENIDLDIVQSPQGYTSLGVVGDMQDLYSQISKMRTRGVTAL